MTHDGSLMAAVVVPSGESLTATTNAGTSVVPLTAGTYASIVAWAAQLQTDLTAGRSVTAGAWQVSVSTGPTGTGQTTISVTNGTFALTFGDANQYSILGFAGNIAATASSTSTSQARGLWMPDCPIFLDGRYLAAPEVTDQREMRSPTGKVISHVGNTYRSHKNVRWTHVPANRVWQYDETVGWESLESFMRDTQWGLGHAWFTTSSKCVITAHDGNVIGGGDVNGWYLTGCRKMQDITQRRGESWDGVWTVSFPEITSDG
jgi:hypothetical protein